MLPLIRILIENIFKPPITEDISSVNLPKHPKGFHGYPEHDPARCIACGICQYFCPAKVIKISQIDDKINYHMDLDQCTCCGQCIDYCPTNAIKHMPNPYFVTTNLDDFKVDHQINLIKCAKCGTFIPDMTLIANKLFGEGKPIPKHLSMCPKCKRKP